MMRLISLFLIAGFLSACQKSETGHPAYFPVNEGWTWVYQQETTFMGKLDRRTFRIENKAPVTFNQEQVHVRQTSDGTDYLIRVTDKIIERIAKRTMVQAKPVADIESRPVLRYPLSVGTSWAHMTPLFVLQRRRLNSSDFQSMLRETPILMNFTLEEIGVQLSTPAGDFDDCLKVEGQGERSLFADADKGFVNVPITQFEWYCRDVGLVRFERHETLVSEFFEGGKLVYELVELQKD